MWKEKLALFDRHALIFVALFSLVLPALAGDQNLWVHGSWVNVRQSSEASSAVITQITTNTPVKLLAQIANTCEIAWGKENKGFIPCRLLGEKPLLLAEVANGNRAGDTAQNPQFSPFRAFWMAPSAAALFSAGLYFQKTMLPPKQYNLETGYMENGTCCGDSEKAPRLVRYAIPEFDAMKALLSNGIVASPDLDPPLLSCQKVQEALLKQKDPGRGKGDLRWNRSYYPEHESFPHAWPMVDDCRVGELPSLRLPTARPSFFNKSSELLPGNAGIERISAHFGIIERGRITGGPRWFFERHGGPRYSGAWDIGKYELKLDMPVVEHVIGRTGLVGAYQWTPLETFEPNGDEGYCAEGLSNKRKGKKLMPGYPAIKDALLWFQSPAALPLQKVKITSRIERIPATKVRPDQDSGYAVQRVATYEIDLDNDGVADFVQWDLWGSPQISGPEPLLILRNVYVNINGEWYPFEADNYAECT